VLFRGGRVDLFAVALAAVSFVAIQRANVPIYFAVPAGALLGMLWRLFGPAAM